ncbi:MAG: NADH-quinone oxidoreductase subunit M, partial [Nevskiales bacterium]
RWSISVPRWISMASMTSVFLMGCWLWLTLDFSQAGAAGLPAWALEFRLPWIPRFGVSVHLGLDGLSLLMVLLTGLLGVMAVACSWREIQQYVGFFHLMLLWNLSGVIGVFLALDLLLFFFFWEVMLVPMYFLIALWGHRGAGGRGRIYAATKFFLFTQASGLIMLVAILALVFVNHGNTGVWTFDYMDLLRAEYGSTAGYLLMLGFFIAFVVKLPAVPFHPWLPDAHSQAPTAGSVDLAGVLLKTGAYGLLRFAIPLFPEASAHFAPAAMWLGVVGIIYGAVVAYSQTDIKRLVAYTSVSHMGFVLVGAYAGNLQALQGVVMQMLAHGVSTGALFILCGEVYERIHTRELGQMGGLWQRLPHLGAIALFFALASLGLPGLGNFVGEILILIGSFRVNPAATVVAATGLVLAAAYALLIMQRAFYGTPRDTEPLEDLTTREFLLLMVLVVILVWFGLYPQPVFDVTEAPMRFIGQTLQGGAAGALP